MFVNLFSISRVEQKQVKCLWTGLVMYTLQQLPLVELWAMQRLVSYCLCCSFSICYFERNLISASIPSLGAGVAFGALLGYGAHLNSQDPPRPLLQLGTSLFLAGLMGARWNRSGKMMPAGMVCLLSMAALVKNLVTYNRYLPLPTKGA